jgi:hypothetical protein
MKEMGKYSIGKYKPGEKKKDVQKNSPTRRPRYEMAKKDVLKRSTKAMLKEG